MHQQIPVSTTAVLDALTDLGAGLAAGKVIVKHEDHVLWIESLLLYNLGPFSHFYGKTVRRRVGQAFSIIGNTVYSVLKTSSDLVMFHGQCALKTRFCFC